MTPPVQCRAASNVADFFMVGRLQLRISYRLAKCAVMIVLLALAVPVVPL
jgi:hypothetical protein